MLRSFFNPLRASVESPPRPSTLSRENSSSTQESDDSDLDFARNVLCELMQNSVESLKLGGNTKTKMEVLAEIHMMMLQDPRTKDIFRNLDGFLALISVLSTLQAGVLARDDDAPDVVLQCTRLVFMIVSEAMHEHTVNAEYFRDRVGYESLFHAMRGFVPNSQYADETMGFLLSLAVHDFSVSGIFSAMRVAEECDLDLRLSEFDSRLSIIRRPGAMTILWDMVPQFTDGDNMMRYGVFKLFELLLQLSHRNQAILSSLGLVKSVFARYCDSRNDDSISEKERSVLQKLLRRLLEMGATTADTRSIFQKAIKADDTLDAEVLDIIRLGMKSRWLEHISLESPAALVMEEEGTKGLPAAGFTVMMWLWISDPPKTTSHPLFKIELASRAVVTLSIQRSGLLELRTSGNRESAVLTESKVTKSRWTHITLVHYPHRVSNPAIRVFIDGALSDALNWRYPRHEAGPQVTSYIFGDRHDKAQMSWCLASAHLLSTPLDDHLPRLIHHLGPRYSGNFQDPNLVKFLTYEASTSLNMFLSNAASKSPVATALSPLMKTIKDGFDLAESSIMFSFSALNAAHSGEDTVISTNDFSREFKIEGDVFIVKAACLDMALWKIGGAAVGLHLVQMAGTSHEISRTLGILTDGLRNNWQNSEDMERLRGYEILADILRGKSQMINMTGFETLFEFLGINFRSPEQSTIVNTVAYRAIALDFELWARTRKEIQRAHLEHFVTVLQTSRYKRFNIKQRFSKMGLVRKLLFVLQTDWYQQDTIPYVVEALKAASQANFSKDDAIKPVASYLAANLQAETISSDSPFSMISRIDYKDPHEKAEYVLGSLIATFTTPAYITKFAATLPLPRICLLWLGERPSSGVATQILLLIGIGLSTSTSFNRKFELVSGWSVLKTVLPDCWNLSVNEAAFDILLGRSGSTKTSGASESHVVACPHIVPVMLSALHTGLASLASKTEVSEDSSEGSQVAESIMEVLIEELMELHSLNSGFRHIFKSQPTTQQFIDAYKSFTSKVTAMGDAEKRIIRTLEKLTHFGLALALDSNVAGGQKQEILDIIHTAEKILNPMAQKTTIDPSLIVDSRSVRERIISSRFSMQSGERAIIKTIARMAEWRKTIQVSERKRLRKNILDLRETRRQVSHLYEWKNILTSERGLWPHQATRLWRLDETEGPYRIRKKLEPKNDKVPSTRVDKNLQRIRDVEVPDTELSSIFHVDVHPWGESSELLSPEIEDRQLAEEITEDKLRRVRHELEPGDVIEAVGTVARISGVDSFPGLLIIGRTHLYMLDGVVENEDGEVIDAHDAPKQLFFVPGSIVELDGSQRAQRWSHDQIFTFSDKRFLFRDVGLEIYFKDSRSLLIVFLNKPQRLDVDQRLSTIICRHSIGSHAAPNILQSSIFGRMGTKMMSGQGLNELATAQRQWQAREISNFTYLSILNQISGRTPSDATQYPVFPWVLQDYTSQILDLTSPESYRDLTKTMGALTAARREAAETRYSNLQSVEEDPFHYGTHFSSSMIVCHFLIRMSPFTNMFKTLQGGDWDIPDRLFSDLARSYVSASFDVRGDVRELIPEFFTCPEFLENSANHDFGIQQTGERIHDVKLPPWARDDPLWFIISNRRALESSYVSEKLPAWIDLIWGCKQRDPSSLNVFHPLSYEGSVDLDGITNELEREATVGIIHNFGQTPRKLFDTPHPHRSTEGLVTLPVGTLRGIEEDPHLLVQGNRCFKDLGPSIAVRDFILSAHGDEATPCPGGVMYVPMHPHEHIEWRIGGAELRLVSEHKTIQVIENAFCNCASFADPGNFVTGCSDYTVRLWKISRVSQHGINSMTNGHITLSHILRVHTNKVICVTASRTWSLVVSGSKDGSAALWDLNRGVYIQSIWHGKDEASDAVHLVAVNESTGYIATCSRSKLCLHTINARPMATLDLTTMSSISRLMPAITSLAFHEREYSHLGILATGGPDGWITLRTWTADGTPQGEKAQWEFVTVRTMKVRMSARAVRPPSVTALKFCGESLCHGEETGKSYLWSLAG